MHLEGSFSKAADAEAGCSVLGTRREKGNLMAVHHTGTLILQAVNM